MPVEVKISGKMPVHNKHQTVQSSQASGVLNSFAEFMLPADNSRIRELVVQPKL
jgi:hypothetical protein